MHMTKEIDEINIIGFHLHNVERPIYFPDPSYMKIVKEVIWNISSLSLLSVWLTLSSAGGRQKLGNNH